MNPAHAAVAADGPPPSAGEGGAARPALLALESVSCRIAGNAVVSSVSLQLQPGELGCLLGPSGCGKTTLLRAIAGFQAIEQGAIRLRGTTASTPQSAQPPEQRGLGFVFQELALFPHLDVAANVGFGLQALARAERAARLDETMSMLGLQDLRGRFPHELSGGQQQRVALARSLAPRPDLLLLDEPFSSLDADLRVRLREDLRQVLQRLGTAAVLVTHDQEEAFAFADRVGVMHAGRLEQWDASFEVYHRPATPFVARFVGEGRFLRARVLDAHRVETTLGILRASKPIILPAGTAVKVLVRPDDIRPDAAVGIEVVVVAASFRGAETHYTLRLADGEEVGALFPSHARHAAGDRIRVQPDIEHVVVFGAD